MSDPTLTSKNLPPVQQPGAVKTSPPVGLPTKPPTSVELEIPYDQIVAKPLRAPNFISLKAKNPNLSLYWGNRAVGEKESGLRFDQLIAMGFVPAKPEDVVTLQGLPCPPSIQRDGKILYGDLILLKIPRADYLGALKWNEQSARQRVKKPGVAISGNTQTADGRLQPAPVLEGPLAKKVSMYTPQLAEVDAKTADNSGPVNLAEK